MNLFRHREYVKIVNEGKPITELNNKELRILRSETASIELFFKIEDELKKRGAISHTFRDSFKSMTGSSIKTD
jgi:hypothetical protein